MAEAMNPFAATQLRAMIESIRLLESFVTAPLGLYSDIKMLRESLPFPEAVELSREETRERRTAYANLTEAPQDLALGTISSIRSAIEILGKIGGENGSPLDAAWISRAGRVLARAEQRVGGDLRARMAARVRGLYVIVDPEATGGRPVLEIAEASLRGGAGVVQLRDKHQDKAEVLAVARRLRTLCDDYGALFVMNDDADVGLSSDAHGLHIGQTDLPVAEARRILAPHQLVGRSNNTVEQAMDSQAQGVDYLAVGAVYATTTMGKSVRAPVGVEMVQKVKELAQQPIVAIGGISADNIVDVVRAGADCACVVSAVTFADDPEAAARRLVELIAAA